MKIDHNYLRQFSVNGNVSQGKSFAKYVEVYMYMFT